MSATRDWRFIEDFSVIDPFKWFRIMPVGKFSKFGRFVEITDETIRDMVDNFRVVPPTRLPVNVEHESTGGKVGDIAALRAKKGDGLYAVIDWTAEGERLLKEQRFQYYSPEIIFGPEDYEGKMVKNILYGLALTNHPYFGNDTALYSLTDSTEGAPGVSPLNVSTLDKENEMPDENAVSEGVVKGLLQFAERFFNAPVAPPVTPPTDPTPAPAPEPVKLTGGQRRAEEIRIATLERELAQAKARNRQNDLVGLMGEEFRSIAEKLALISDEALADEIAEEFHAFAVQADQAALFAEFGTGSGDRDANLTAADRYLAEVEQAVEKMGLTRAQAHSIVSEEHPELYRAYRKFSASREEEE